LPEWMTWNSLEQRVDEEQCRDTPRSNMITHESHTFTQKNAAKHAFTHTRALLQKQVDTRR